MSAMQPNILLITTDQQRYDASGGAGPSFLRTPHYDRLRYEGVLSSPAAIRMIRFACRRVWAS